MKRFPFSSMASMLVAILILLTLLTYTAYSQSIDSVKSRTAVAQKAETAVTLSFDPNKLVSIGYSTKITRPWKINYFWNFRLKLEVHTARTLTVDSIELSIKDGFIVNILVRGNGEEYTNKDAPIALTSERLNKNNDKLSNSKNKDEYILIGDVLKWDFNNTDVPDDNPGFTLDRSKPSYTLVRNLGIDNVLSLQLYTDAIGLFGGTSNAIAQTEAQYRHIIVRRNYRNIGLMLPFEYLKINFSAAKFDSKDRYVDVASFSRTTLLQKSFLNLEASTNLVYFWLEKKSPSYGYLDIGAGMNDGILAKKNDTVSVLTPNLFTEAGLNFRPSPNLGVDLSLRFINQYSTQTNFVNSAGYNQGGQEQFLKFGGDLFWNPTDKSSGRIFTRFYYVIARQHFEQVNNFFQFQFGYSILLSSVAGKKQASK